MYKFLFSFISLSFNAHALEITSPIIIQADRFKTELSKVSSNVKVISQEEIQKHSQIDELLAAESDLTITRSGPKGSSSSIFLRGTDSAHTLVIIDGIVMNDPSNPNRQFDIGRLSLNNIEQIEIIKGSQGLLYGANAIGGVILITSKSSTDKTRTIGTLEYGSFNTLMSGISFNKNFDDSFLSLSLDALSSDGFSAVNDQDRTKNDKDGDKRINFHGQYKKDLENNADVALVYRRTHDEYDIDKSSFKDDPNDFIKNKEEYFKVTLNQSFETSESQMNYTKTLHERKLNIVPDEFDPTELLSTSRGENQTMNFNHTRFWNDIFSQIYQIEFQNESMKIDQSKKQKNENLSYFIYNRFEFDQHVLNFGLRLDDNEIFKNSLNYKFSYLFSWQKFLFRTNLSSGLKTPSLNQLLDPTYGNRDLRPEESLSYDIGIEYKPNAHQKFTTSFFETYIKDRHSYDPLTYINLNDGKAKITGIETAHTFFLTQDFKWQNSYTWLEAYNQTTATRLLRRPTHSFASVATYQIDLQRYSLEGRYIGTREDINQSFLTVKNPSYVYFNFFYDYDFNEKLSANFKINNLFNKKYEEVIGFNSGQRSVAAGLKYNF